MDTRNPIENEYGRILFLGDVAVEGYAKVIEHRDEYDFTGPIHLYEKAGFSQIIEQNGVAVMRKLL